MMQDGVLVAAGDARQPFIPFSKRAEPFVHVGVRQREIRFPPDRFHVLRAFVVNAQSFAVFSFIEHWHFLPAPPAPQRLHLIPF